MDDQEKMLKKMRDVALNNPEKIRIVETNVDAEMQIEFFETLQKINLEKPEVDLLKFGEELDSLAVNLNRKKEILAILSGAGEIETFRFLENYIKSCPQDLKSWALLACQQGQMFLESALLDESKIYIASGLGGKEHRLRYVFSLANSTKDAFSDFQKGVLEKEFNYYLLKNDSIIEDLQFVGIYAVCKALVPLYIDIVNLIQDVVSEVNQYGDFIKENLFITNEKLVDESYLDQIFAKDE